MGERLHLRHGPKQPIITTVVVEKPKQPEIGRGRLKRKYQLHIERMSTKEILLEVADQLPPDASLVDAICELEFRQAVEDGLASLDRGQRVPLEEARKRIPQWISKYSSPTTR